MARLRQQNPQNYVAKATSMPNLRMLSGISTVRSLRKTLESFSRFCLLKTVFGRVQLSSVMIALRAYNIALAPTPTPPQAGQL